MWRRVGYLLILFPFLFMVVSAGRDTLVLDPVKRASAPYHYRLLEWELVHLPQKWFHILKQTVLRDQPTRSERLALVEEYFKLQDQINQVSWQVQLAAADSSSSEQLPSLETSLARLWARQQAIKADVEEALEAEISAVLEDEGFATFFGVLFPPVDFVLGRTPNVLVLSPRDRIQIARTMLLHPSMSISQMQALEDHILSEENLSALVERTGGVATYPSVVYGGYGLRNTLNIAVHEWLHQYLIFYPLGRNYSRNGDMTTLNETLANIVGEELGDKVYERITGKKLVKVSETVVMEESADPVFDFNQEMRETRSKVETLLAQGKVEEAEQYMEERRRYFVEHGYHIRKLNQAYFAFHGSYADGPASISPVEQELRELRRLSESPAQFVRRVAQFGDYGEFQEYLKKLKAEGATH